MYILNDIFLTLIPVHLLREPQAGTMTELPLEIETNNVKQ